MRVVLMLLSIFAVWAVVPGTLQTPKVQLVFTLTTLTMEKPTARSSTSSMFRVSKFYEVPREHCLDVIQQRVRFATSAKSPVLKDLKER